MATDHSMMTLLPNQEFAFSFGRMKIDSVFSNIIMIDYSKSDSRS